MPSSSKNCRIAVALMQPGRCLSTTLGGNFKALFLLFAPANSGKMLIDGNDLEGAATGVGSGGAINTGARFKLRAGDGDGRKIDPFCCVLFLLSSACEEALGAFASVSTASRPTLAGCICLLKLSNIMAVRGVWSTDCFTRIRPQEIPCRLRIRFSAKSCSTPSWAS